MAEAKAPEKDLQKTATSREKTPVVVSEDFAETVLSIRRVAKVIEGGRRLTFAVLVVVGDRKGNVGIASGKATEVSSAISKAVRLARKNMVSVELYKTTIPFDIEGRHGASKVLLRSASKGTGLIAGGAVRAVIDALGVKDILAKSLGSSNPSNVARATLNALEKLRSAKEIAHLRGKKLSEIIGDKNVAAQ